MKKILIGLTIILLAFFFRFNNLNWDANFHLHPDERFLTMVGNAMKLPTTVNQYFNQKTSLMNPANVGYNFFVYGRFPLILTKYLAVIYKLDNYNDFTILGRQLSAFFDILIIFFIIKTVELLEKKSKISPSTKYWAGFFYTIAVLPIQLSHFFAVDTFLNFFMFGSFYFALKSSEARTSGFSMTLLSAVFFGLALACKVTAIFILPLNLFFLIKTVFEKKLSLVKTVFIVFLYFVLAYFTLRLADPYLFQTNNFFNPTLNTQFVGNIKQLKSFEGKDIWYPPAVQWLKKPAIIFSLINLMVFGVGIFYFIFIVIGIFKTLISKKYELSIILTWITLFFLYQSTQFVKAMRYFIFVYPFLAIFAGIGISKLFETKNYLFHVLCFIVLLFWPLMFSSIYFNKNTRVEASEWIYKNLPNGSYILSEYWDDALPMPVVNTYGKTFSGLQLKVFDPDTPGKWQLINQELAKADYYILSSNRGWGSITTVPKKYPLMSKFYNELLANKNPNYKKIKEFTSYPSLKYLSIPLELSDQWSDENFTVFDHPKVIIYKNSNKIIKSF